MALGDVNKPPFVPAYQNPVSGVLATQEERGTHFENGVRVGPIFNEREELPAKSGNYYSAPSGTYHGIQLSPLTHYVFKPLVRAQDKSNPSKGTIDDIKTQGKLSAKKFVPLNAVKANPLGIIPVPAVMNGHNVLKLDVARALSFINNKDDDESNLAIFGYDIYGQEVCEFVTVPKDITGIKEVQGKKAFLAIKAIYSISEISVAIGVSEYFGLPYRIAYNDKRLDLFCDFYSASPTVNSVRGVVTGGFSPLKGAPIKVSNSTDVRGLVTFPKELLEGTVVSGAMIVEGALNRQIFTPVLRTVNGVDIQDPDAYKETSFTDLYGYPQFNWTDGMNELAITSLPADLSGV